MKDLKIFPVKAIPWASIVKYASIAGVGGLLLTVGYVKGDGDRNAKWLKTENARIKAEADARMEAMQAAHDLNIKSAVSAADALARADEKARAASDRAKEAENARNATRRQNDALYADLKDAQDAAVNAGDLAGRGLMPAIVREQTADRIDRICARRPTECGSATARGSEIQRSAAEPIAGQNLAGGYPAPTK